MKFEIETNLNEFTEVQKQMLVDAFMKRVTKAYIDSLELTDEQKNQIIKQKEN